MTFGVSFQQYEYMINGGSSTFMVASNGVYPPYEKSNRQCSFVTIYAY
jgi:hypothetical protein